MWFNCIQPLAGLLHLSFKYFSYLIFVFTVFWVYSHALIKHGLMHQTELLILGRQGWILHISKAIFILQRKLLTLLWTLLLLVILYSGRQFWPIIPDCNNANNAAGPFTKKRRDEGKILSMRLKCRFCSNSSHIQIVEVIKSEYHKVIWEFWKPFAFMEGIINSVQLRVWQIIT